MATVQTRSKRLPWALAYALKPSRETFKVDCDWSDVELAAVPCAYSTAEGMLHRANVRAGERIVRKIDDETHASSGCMLHNIGPRLDEIEAEVAAVSGLREKPAGTIRITATENATETILVPKLAPLLQKYPDIKVEIIIDYGLTNIVAQQYDAGVRSGEQVARGTPQDLIGHNCINLRLPVHGGVYVCDSSRGSRAKSALDLAG